MPPDVTVGCLEIGLWRMPFYAGPNAHDTCLPLCSASNYLLGFTPLGYGPFITGTLAGMSVWSLVYASIGGAGRSLLQQGQADLGQILQGGLAFLCTSISVKCCHSLLSIER